MQRAALSQRVLGLRAFLYPHMGRSELPDMKLAGRRGNTFSNNVQYNSITSLKLQQRTSGLPIKPILHQK